MQSLQGAHAGVALADARPNILLILYDDLGYGDFGVYGNQAYHTPAIDQLAHEGATFTQYYAPSPVCTPSRVALLTGRYAPRTGVSHVVFPRNSLMDWWMRINGQTTMLPHDEILLPEILRASGYRTAMVGKWHLGDMPGSLPNDFGFDTFFGSRYSNDMNPFVLYENNKISVPAPVDQTQLNDLYTDAVLRTINTSSEKPFLIYLAHNMPHEPLHASAKFYGKSGSGLYGDVIEELDDGVRRIVEALKQQGKYDNTLILITSDNGPWFQGAPGGRGRKGSTFEGGMHVPMIVHWPQHIKPGTITTPVVGVDVLSTILDYLGIALPADRQLDGISWKSLFSEAPSMPARGILYFGVDKLMALRNGNLKYQTRKNVSYQLEPSFAVPFIKGPWLFDLEHDPLESYDLLSSGNASLNPIVQQFERAEQDFVANPRGWIAVSRESMAASP